jgi:nucleoside-diphosphate-sugar epimerase
MRHCTVLGGSGYIGGHLVAHLQRQGWDCRVPARGDESYLAHDLGVVFYCVGLTADFRTRPLETVEAHVGLLQRVLRQGRFARLVYLSSTRVYLGAADTGEDQVLCAHPGNPDDLYKLSKLMGESLALHSGRSCVVARLSNVVGGANGNPDSFVYSLLRDARKGHIILRSDPQSAKDYIHVADVVQSLAQLALGSQHQLYNVASGVQIAHRQWLDLLATGTGCSWVVSPDAPCHLALPVRVQRLSEEFSWAPRDVLQAMAHDLANSNQSTTTP